MPTYFSLGRSKTVGRVRIDQPVTQRQIIGILLLLSQDKYDRNNKNRQKSEANRHLLTQEEAADRLRCSVWTVKRLRLTGKLKYIPGRPNLIRVDDIDEFERSAAQLN
ncbi:helix-turn-helix domain-containing protein, partial [Escherichia coli]|uniref:helix-turn-helix domain-containing protein n=1 Tax=Escherichia coli TaxID=562 RepID=UPI0011E92A3D